MKKISLEDKIVDRKILSDLRAFPSEVVLGGDLTLVASQRASEYHQKYHQQHKDQINAQKKQDYYERVEEYKARQRATNLERKKLVLSYYGGRCACCGEIRYEFLCIDHIEGGGNKHKKERNNAPIYGWLVKHDFPEGFRVLCWNCNSSLGAFGYCPHQLEEI